MAVFDSAMAPAMAERTAIMTPSQYLTFWGSMFLLLMVLLFCSAKVIIIFDMTKFFSMFHVEQFAKAVIVSALQDAAFAAATADRRNYPSNTLLGPTDGSPHGGAAAGGSASHPRPRQGGAGAGGHDTDGSPHGGAAAGGTTSCSRHCAAPIPTAPREGGGGRKAKGEGRRATLRTAAPTGAPPQGARPNKRTLQTACAGGRERQGRAQGAPRKRPGHDHDVGIFHGAAGRRGLDAPDGPLPKQKETTDADKSP